MVAFARSVTGLGGEPRGNAPQALAFWLGHDTAVAGFAAEVGKGRVGAHGWRGRPVPIIESRVTSAASASSPSASVPAGRIGSTR